MGAGSTPHIPSRSDPTSRQSDKQPYSVQHPPCSQRAEGHGGRDRVSSGSRLIGSDPGQGLRQSTDQPTALGGWGGGVTGHARLLVWLQLCPFAQWSGKLLVDNQGSLGAKACPALELGKMGKVAFLSFLFKG